MILTLFKPPHDSLPFPYLSVVSFNFDPLDERTLEVEVLRQTQQLEMNLMHENVAKQTEVDKTEFDMLVAKSSGALSKDVKDYLNAMVEQEKNLLKEKHIAVLRLLSYSYEKKLEQVRGQQQIEQLETQLLFKHLEWDLKYEHQIIVDTPGAPTREDILVSETEMYQKHAQEIQKQVERNLEKLKTQYKKAKARLRYLNVDESFDGLDSTTTSPSK